jgi:alcohol dehydrogenase class IV
LLSQDRVFVGKNDLSDHFALQAIGLLWRGLGRACANGADAAARAQVMQGALLAGMAFGVAGTAAAHAIQYPVGALTHTPHGLGVACLMPYVLTWNAPMIGPELEDMARAMGLGSGTLVIPAITTLFARIGIPVSLSALGVQDGKLDWVADQALGITRLIQNSRRPLAAAGMARLLAAAQAGDVSRLAKD